MTLGNNTTGKDLKERLLYLGLLMIAGLLALVVRLYRLQITEGQEYAQKSVANFVKEIRVRADRGMIKDRRGTVLVDNRPSFDVFVTPAFCQHCFTEVLPKLAQYLGWDEGQKAHAEQLVKVGKRDAPFQQMPVRVDLTRDELDVLSAHLLELPGVDVVPVAHRSYHEGPVLSHVLGYMNEINEDELERLDAKGAHYGLGDFIGRRGVERFFEEQLRGVDGSRKEVVNARGEAIPGMEDLLGPNDTVAPKPGDNVVLSIDMRLQAAAEKAFPGVAGALVVVDVHTGFIRAIVSRPGFDPNLLTGRVTPAQLDALNKDPLQPMIFRATQQHYSPGSTFKAIVSLAGLRSGKFGPHSRFTCAGGYRLGRRVWRCDDERGHGPLDYEDALKVSCDVFFYHLGDMLGLQPIADVAKSFGFGAPTGIGVVAEVPGILPDEAWYARNSREGYQKYQAINASIGQGDVNVTPLQLAMAYAALGNGGTLYTPQLVERIESATGKVVKTFAPKIVRDIGIDPEQRKIILAGLTKVVNEPGGTAYATHVKDLVKGVVFAGKTGTAQVRAIGAVRKKESQLTFWEKSNSWFAGLAPADAPEIAVVVINEHGGYGASGAAPAVANVMQAYFELKRQDAQPQPVAGTASATPGTLANTTVETH